MKTLVSSMLVLFVALSFVGCATYNPQGIIYTEVKAPTTLGTGDLKYSKTGTAMATSVLGLVATGDASLETAADNGGIKEIKYAEYSVRNILGIYGEYKTTVYGN